MPDRYVHRPVTCDHKKFASLPAAHVQMRFCKETGKSYWTVDQDPHENCPLHQEEKDGDTKD